MSENLFRIIENEFYGGDEWPDGETYVVSILEGPLAERIRRAVGADRDAEVRIVERGQEGGYSEYTIEWDYDFDLIVGGQEVDFDEWASSSISEQWGQETMVGKLSTWLEAKEAKRS